LKDKSRALPKGFAPFLVHSPEAADCAVLAASETVQNKDDKCRVISDIYLTVKPI
jgi:hypothetical protein